LVAIFEGGTWTPDQIMAKSLGLSPEQQMNQQANKKRQTSKSKKRQKELLGTHTNDAMVEQANAECHHRGAMACHTAVMYGKHCRRPFEQPCGKMIHPAKIQMRLRLKAKGQSGAWRLVQMLVFPIS
jgi:hypothetical protein